MTTHWLDLDFATSQFYKYSKLPQEGYKEHTTTTGTTSYRQHFSKGVFGLLQSVDILDTKFGQRLTVRVLNGDNIYVMKFPLMNEKGTFDNRYGEPLICLLPNLEKNAAYRFYPYSMESVPGEGQTARTFYGISVKTADLDSEEVDEKVMPAYTRAKKDEPVGPNNIPSLEFKLKLGKYIPTATSIEAKEDFLESILTAEIERLGYKQSSTQSQSKPAPKGTSTGTTGAKTPVNPAAKPIVDSTNTFIDEAEDDDLPF